MLNQQDLFPPLYIIWKFIDAEGHAVVSVSICSFSSSHHAKGESFSLFPGVHEVDFTLEFNHYEKKKIVQH